MINAGGVIQRVVTSPTFGVQYLKTDAAIVAGAVAIFTLADLERIFPHVRPPQSGRIDPEAVRELLSVSVPAEWCDRRIEAIFFASHAEADARAALLRIATRDTIYAAVAKPAEHIKRPETDTAGFQPVRELPSKKKRETRSDRERAEMRESDIAALNEVANNG